MVTKPDETPTDRATETAGKKKPPVAPETASPKTARPDKPRPVEIGGRDGPDPTRYGDWEKNGRAIDF